MLAVFKREFKSYFSSPLGYAFLAVMFFFSGLFFYATLKSNTSDLSNVFLGMFYVCLVVIPLLTMRLLSDEKRQKTDQLLLTSPVNISGIVWGKFLAAFVMYLIGISITIFYFLVMSAYAAPDFNVFIGNFLALALLGAALLSIGLFMSSLTESQIVAAIITYVIMLFVFFIDMIVTMVPDTLSWLKTVLSSISFLSRYYDLVNGLIDVSHIIFFGSFVVVFNFLSIRMLERKRWS